MGDDKQPYRWWENVNADELCVIHAGVVEPGNDLGVWREHHLEERFGVNSRTFQEYGQRCRDRPYMDLQKLRKRLGRRACELHNVDLGEEDPKKAAALLTLFEIMATCAKDATRVKAAREVSNYFVVKIREREAKHKEELHLLEIEPDQISRLYLAGAFGNYIRPESARRIGLLPNIELGRIQSIGNAAGTGAREVLLSRLARKHAKELSVEMEYIELAGRPEFQDIFGGSMMFPEQ